MSQLVKNLPAMWETWVWSLGWEDPLEKGKATHSSILVQYSMDWLYSPWNWLLLTTFWDSERLINSPKVKAAGESGPESAPFNTMSLMLCVVNTLMVMDAPGGFSIQQEGETPKEEQQRGKGAKSRAVCSPEVCCEGWMRWCPWIPLKKGLEARGSKLDLFS